jgi:aminoglycoside phosphotransferase (APT) family kinase protein
MPESKQGAVRSTLDPIRFESDAVSTLAPQDIAEQLLEYLADYLGIQDLSYACSPTEYPDGWETYSYTFQLRAGRALPAEFAKPLVIRLYASPEGLPRARYEVAVERQGFAQGFPLPQTLLLEEDCRLLGGPFVIRVQAPGRTLLQAMLKQPWRLWSAPRQMALAQVQLHRLSPRGFPAPKGPWLTRCFQELAEILERYELETFRAGYEWLHRHRPAPPRRTSIVHLDFHPINLIHQPGQPLLVLDWVEADVADRHVDVATSLMLMECVTAGTPTWHARLLAGLGRFWFVRWYLRAYRRRLPLDWNVLCYYRALAAFRRLCCYARWLRAGPRITGCKPSLLRHLDAEHLEQLGGYFRKWTGVRLQL